MDTQRSRITIFAPTGRADLAVPNRVPLALLLPLLFDELKIKSRAGAEAWEIAGVDGRPISRDSSLHDADIGDGDLLFVRRTEDEDRQLYDDVVEIICDEGAQAAWPPEFTAIAATAFGVIVMLMAVVGLTLNVQPPLSALIGAGAAVILGVVAFAVSKNVETRPGVPVAIVLAACWAAFVGNALAGGMFDGAGVLAAAAAFEAACLIGGLVLRMTNPLVYAASALSALAAVGGSVLLVTGKLPLAAAIVAAGGLVALMTAPSFALRLAGVAALDGLPENDVSVPVEVARRSIRRTTLALSGLIVGITIATVGAVVVLTCSADARGYALAVGVVLLTLIRAPTFRDRWQVGTLAGGVLCGLIALIAAISWTDGVMLSALVVVVACCFLKAVAVTLRWRSYRLERLSDMVEMVLMIAVMPAVLLIGGAYGAVLSLWD